MKKMMLALLTLGSFSVLGAARADDECEGKKYDRNFELHNGGPADFVIVSIYIDEAKGDPSTKDYGQDIEKSVVPVGEARKVTIPDSWHPCDCVFDLKINDENGKGWYIDDFNVCENSKVVFTKEGDKVVHTKQ